MRSRKNEIIKKIFFHVQNEVSDEFVLLTSTQFASLIVSYNISRLCFSLLHTIDTIFDFPMISVGNRKIFDDTK